MGKFLANLIHDAIDAIWLNLEIFLLGIVAGYVISALACWIF